jgi:hypothetical protein
MTQSATTRQCNQSAQRLIEWSGLGINATGLEAMRVEAFA